MKKSSVSTFIVIFEFIMILLFIVSLITFFAYLNLDKKEAFKDYDLNPTKYDNIVSLIVILSLSISIYLLLTIIITFIDMRKLNNAINKSEIKICAYISLFFGIITGILMLNVKENSFDI